RTVANDTPHTLNACNIGIPDATASSTSRRLDNGHGYPDGITIPDQSTLH
ncbi:hypothetical protein APR04_003721, partial [Promicromonospora umidemergens]|nr:hypothetical protein [Promicromonospora umidemergens]MCP2284798.1 hypothetical protein [Promicromonospora umidemergens]